MEKPKSGQIARVVVPKRPKIVASGERTAKGVRLVIDESMAKTLAMKREG